MTTRSLSWWTIPRLSALASTLGWTRCSCCVNRTSSCTLRWTGFLSSYGEKKSDGNMPDGEDLQEVWVSIWAGRASLYLCRRLAPSPSKLRAGMRTSPQEGTASCRPLPPLSPHSPPPTGTFTDILSEDPRPPGEPRAHCLLGTVVFPSGLTGSFFAFSSCFWARSLSANCWASRGLEAAAAVQNGFGTRQRRLPTPCPEPRTRRRSTPQLGAAILPRRAGRVETPPPLTKGGGLGGPCGSRGAEGAGETRAESRERAR